MLALLMTYADDWTFNRDHLMKTAKIGRDKFQRIMRELIGAGYVSREPVRSEGGQVRGSTWFINDDPNREPENPVVGDTEDLLNRQPGKPTAGFSGPLRRPTDKNTKREECVRNQTEAIFATFWETYPRPRDREKSQSLFVEAVSGGVDPKAILAAAKAYHKENNGNGKMYLSYSDNWLANQRWRDIEGTSQSLTDKDKIEATASYFAARAKAGKPLFGLSNAVRMVMLERNMVTVEELKCVDVF